MRELFLKAQVANLAANDKTFLISLTTADGRFPDLAASFSSIPETAQGAHRDPKAWAGDDQELIDQTTDSIRSYFNNRLGKLQDDLKLKAPSTNCIKKTLKGEASEMAKAMGIPNSQELLNEKLKESPVLPFALAGVFSLDKLNVTLASLDRAILGRALCRRST